MDSDPNFAEKMKRREEIVREKQAAQNKKRNFTLVIK